MNEKLYQIISRVFNVESEKINDKLMIVGESGIGKSSLLRCVAGLWDFAYGSNLHHFQMKRRCKDSTFLKKINLNNFKLT